MSWLAATLALYRSAFARAAEVTVQNWWVLATLFAYGGIMLATLVVASPLGILGGFLVSFVWAACIGSFLYVVEMLVRNARVTLEDFRRSFAVYLWDVVGVTFVLWLFWQIVTPALASLPYGPPILMSLQLLIFVFFNAVPELIYCGHNSALELLVESYRFIGENWIEWFPPNLALAAALWALAQAPASGLAGYALLALTALFVYYAMVVRGFLFLELSSTSRRSRVFRRRMGS